VTITLNSQDCTYILHQMHQFARNNRSKNIESVVTR